VAGRRSRGRNRGVCVADITDKDVNKKGQGVMGRGEPGTQTGTQSVSQKGGVGLEEKAIRRCKKMGSSAADDRGPLVAKEKGRGEARKRRGRGWEKMRAQESTSKIHGESEGKERKKSKGRRALSTTKEEKEIPCAYQFGRAEVWKKEKGG